MYRKSLSFGWNILSKIQPCADLSKNKMLQACLHKYVLVQISIRLTNRPSPTLIRFPVFRWIIPVTRLKNFGKIIGVIISHFHACVLDTDGLIFQQPLGFVNTKISKIRSKILVKTLFKKFAEIRV